MKRPTQIDVARRAGVSRSTVSYVLNDQDELKIPISEETRLAAYKFQLDPTACALSGGEDYELLFTIRQEDYDKLTTNEEISVVGYITDEEEGRHIITKGGNRHPITAQGWNAFQ